MLTRNFPHGVQNVAVTHTAPDDLLIDHAFALSLEVHGDAASRVRTSPPRILPAVTLLLVLDAQGASALAEALGIFIAPAIVWDGWSLRWVACWGGEK
ncbi:MULTISPECIES: hypothetical protein [unclassified Pseudoxanthomonas]|uniref:hypothetical protein n=1 Tax=unclassified Pseudoxanthomonas TaxID=2645906 RepID=UPI003076CF7A